MPFCPIAHKLETSDLIIAMLSFILHLLKIDVI